jgi:hypothetical protein
VLQVSKSSGEGIPLEFLALAITNLKANRGVPASMRWPSAAVSAD